MHSPQYQIVSLLVVLRSPLRPGSGRCSRSGADRSGKFRGGTDRRARATVDTSIQSFPESVVLHQQVIQFTHKSLFVGRIFAAIAIRSTFDRCSIPSGKHSHECFQVWLGEASDDFLYRVHGHLRHLVLDRTGIVRHFDEVLRRSSGLLTRVTSLRLSSPSISFTIEFCPAG